MKSIFQAPSIMSPGPKVGDWLQLTDGNRQWVAVFLRRLPNGELEVHEFRQVRNKGEWLPVWTREGGRHMKHMKWKPSGYLPLIWNVPDSLLVRYEKRRPTSMWTFPDRVPRDSALRYHVCSDHMWWKKKANTLTQTKVSISLHVDSVSMACCLI